MTDLIFHALPMLLIIWALALAFSSPRKRRYYNIEIERDPTSLKLRRTMGYLFKRRKH